MLAAAARWLNGWNGNRQNRRRGRIIMALERAGTRAALTQPAAVPAPGGGAGSPLFSVSAAGLQRYEEAVFRITADGEIEPANPVATEFAQRLSPEDLVRLTTAAAKSKLAERAMVDLVDVGAGDKQQNLQITLVPLDGGAGTLLFVRDLTLDNSLRLALVDSRRRYKDFIEISTDFAWE